MSCQIFTESDNGLAQTSESNQIIEIAGLRHSAWFVGSFKLYWCSVNLISFITSTDETQPHWWTSVIIYIARDIYAGVISISRDNWLVSASRWRHAATAVPESWCHWFSSWRCTLCLVRWRLCSWKARAKKRSEKIWVTSSRNLCFITAASTVSTDWNWYTL